MGIVYEASDMELHRRVAVKFIGGRRPSDESAVARFRREARALAALQHPNIVTIFDVGSTANGRSYLVMELLRGTTLRSELATRGPLTLHVVTEILHGICAAVDAAHRQSVIHRDLKPENVFLTEQEAGRVPKVLDFGLARLSDADGTTVTLARNTTVGAIIGTPRYIAPERIQGDPGAEAADIWAIGVIAYEMLTGIHPFSNLSGVIVREQCFTPIGEHIHNAPAQWQDFFIHTLAFEPANRPKSPRLLFAEFLQAFQTEAR